MGSDAHRLVHALLLRIQALLLRSNAGG